MTTEPSDRFRALSRIFDLAVDTPDDLRDDLIRRECHGDPELEREVRELLAVDAVDASEAYVIGMIAEEAAAMTSPPLAGRRLGAWAIERPIGEGGMGVVYRAVRADGEYDATVAIKLVRGGAASAFLHERVRSERQILAGLSHPGIAQLLDGGTTEDGTPYLVMEHVDGQPITTWCDEHDVDVEGKLRLFLKVCDAVAYAHGALVAHRDLKPSNILVTTEGEPKLLDFGIAKLVDTVSDSDVTQSYGVMTPAYASPEQVTGVRAGVATDIYALGVLLYEILTGRLPIDTRGLTSPQVAAKITTEVPPLVSASTDDSSRRRRLRGDLDAIVSRALRKEPERRYDSVASFADDIRRHLDGRPIESRRDDWTYRAWKSVRRNKGMVAAAAVLAIMVTAFAMNALFQARALARERDAAAAERETAERVSGFLEELLTEADPDEPASLDMTARDVLDRGAQRVFSGLREEPIIQAQLAMVMGRVYRRLGEYDAAGPLLDSAVDVLQREAGTSAALGDAFIERSALWYDVGDYERALEVAERARATFAGVGSRDDPRMASALDWMSASLQELGRMEEAERYTAEMVDMYRRIDPEPNADLASALTAYSDLLRTAGHLDHALAIGEEALAMARTLYGDDHLEVASALNQMTSTLRELGRAEEAIPLVEEGLAIRRANFHGPHVEIAASLGNLANVYIEVGRLEEAVQARRESHAMLEEIFPGPHPYKAASLNSLGNVLTQVGRYDEAEQLLLESVAMHRLLFPPGHPNIAFPLTGLGRLYMQQGRYEEAEPLLREAYETRKGALPEGHWEVAPSALELARALDALGREQEAEAFFEESHATLLENFGRDDARTSEAREALRDHLLRRGMTEQAARLGS